LRRVAPVIDCPLSSVFRPLDSLPDLAMTGVWGSSVVAGVRQQGYSPRQGGENSVIARSAATWQSGIVRRGGEAAGNVAWAAWQSVRRLGFLKRQGAVHVCVTRVSGWGRKRLTRTLA
jgi:hypothetical protein